MATVLITGSEGNLGSYICKRLYKTHPSWKVIRIKHAQGACRFNSETGIYEGDLCDAVLLERLFAEHQIEYVIHAASKSYSHGGYNAHPFSIIDNDTSLLLNLLRHSRSASKFIYLSSALIYEHSVYSPLEEDTSNLLTPTSSYGVAKWFGENAVRMFHIEHGVNFTIWRPFNIVSPLEPHEGEGRHVFVDFFRRLFIESVPEFSIMGSGNQVRCFMWVEDAADCIVDNLEKIESNGQTFNLARDEPITLLNLKDLLLDLGHEMHLLPQNYNPPTIKRGTFSGVESEVRVPSVKKLKSLLMWESNTTVRECFYKFIKGKLENDY